MAEKTNDFDCGSCCPWPFPSTVTKPERVKGWARDEPVEPSRVLKSWKAGVSRDAPPSPGRGGGDIGRLQRGRGEGRVPTTTRDEGGGSVGRPAGGLPSWPRVLCAQQVRRPPRLRCQGLPPVGACVGRYPHIIAWLKGCPHVWTWTGDLNCPYAGAGEPVRRGCGTRTSGSEGGSKKLPRGAADIRCV